MPDLSIRHHHCDREGYTFFVWSLSLVVSLIAALLVQERTENKRFLEDQRHSVVEQLSTIRAQLEGELNAELLLTHSIITEIVIHADIRKEKFFEIAQHLMEESKHIENIGLARGTVLTYVYPVQGNEAAIGMDYRKNTRQWPAVKQAVDERKTVITGPSDLVQGGSGLISRTTLRSQDLQARLSKNSRNSGKPPSSDGYNKKNRTASLRKPGQKSNGGQPGHKGHTLERSETPDHTETHKPDECTNCRTSLEEVIAVGEEERQVYDIPAIRIEVTAHRAEIKICPGCGTENRGEFPENVERGVRYGTGIKTWAAYFGNQHHIPLERTAQIIEDLTGHGISEVRCSRRPKSFPSAFGPRPRQLRSFSVMPRF